MLGAMVLQAKEISTGLRSFRACNWANQAPRRSITSEVGFQKAWRIRSNRKLAKNRAHARGWSIFGSVLYVVGLAACPAFLSAQNSQPAKNPQSSTQSSQSAPGENSHPVATSVPNFPGSPSGLLASYEGQNVSSIEVAGRTDIDATKFAPQFVQQQAQPFSEQKVNQTADAIKSAGKFDGVRVDVNPEADGVRVIYVVQPAVYFGIFKFPGAEQFPVLTPGPGLELPDPGAIQLGRG